MFTLTNFPVIGKWSNSLTTPKSSPVATALPLCVTQAVFTSALSALRGQIPTISGPKTLSTKRQSMNLTQENIVSLI